MPRKPNYDFEKRRKEMDRKAKKDAKREDRLRRKQEGGTEDADAPTSDTPDQDGDETVTPLHPGA